MKEIHKQQKLSISKACKLLSVSKTAYYYHPKRKTQADEIKSYLRQLADSYKRWGFKKMLDKAKQDGKGWNHKRVYRIYCEMGLNIRIKPRKRLLKGEAKILAQPIKANVCWSLDFMSDVLSHGQRFRTCNAIDDYNRQGLLVAPGFSLPTQRVIQLLDDIALSRGYPDMIRVDNGTEFTSSDFKHWADKHGIFINYIQPGKPAQNGFIERFNRTYREDVLDMHIFNHLQEVKEITQQ